MFKLITDLKFWQCFKLYLLNLEEKELSYAAVAMRIIYVYYFLEIQVINRAIVSSDDHVLPVYH